MPWLFNPKSVLTSNGQVEEEEFGPSGAPPEFATNPITGEQYELADWARDGGAGE